MHIWAVTLFASLSLALWLTAVIDPSRLSPSEKAVQTPHFLVFWTTSWALFEFLQRCLTWPPASRRALKNCAKVGPTFSSACKGERCRGRKYRRLLGRRLYENIKFSSLFSPFKRNSIQSLAPAFFCPIRKRRKKVSEFNQYLPYSWINLSLLICSRISMKSFPTIWFFSETNFQYILMFLVHYISCSRGWKLIEK